MTTLKRGFCHIFPGMRAIIRHANRRHNNRTPSLESDDDVLCCNNGLWCSQSRCVVLIIGTVLTGALYFVKTTSHEIELSWLIVFVPVGNGVLTYLFTPFMLLFIALFANLYSCITRCCTQSRNQCRTLCCCCSKPRRVAPILPT